jgi:hypothetical protein
MITITTAAIKLKNGEIYTGKNHSECYLACNKIHPIEEKEHLNAQQGFITSEENFVSRADAAKIAFEAKQIQNETNSLHSEDLNFPILVCPKCKTHNRCRICGNEFEDATINTNEKKLQNKLDRIKDLANGSLPTTDYGYIVSAGKILEVIEGK